MLTGGAVLQIDLPIQMILPTGFLWIHVLPRGFHCYLVYPNLGGLWHRELIADVPLGFYFPRREGVHVEDWQVTAK